MAAVIVEPRSKHPNMEAVLRNVRRKLGREVPIYWLHGVHPPHVEMENLFTHPLRVDNLDLDGYNSVMLNPRFYLAVPAKFMLVFQTDSVLFAKSLVKVESLKQWDYVGAPWPHRYHRMLEYATRFVPSDDVSMGNGGLSWRSRSRCLEALFTYPPETTSHNTEDLYLAAVMSRLAGISLPTPEQAAEIFFEKTYPKTKQLPLGAHKWIPHGFSHQLLPSERNILMAYTDQSDDRDDASHHDNYQSDDRDDDDSAVASAPSHRDNYQTYSYESDHEGVPPAPAVKAY